MAALSNFKSETKLPVFASVATLVSASSSEKKFIGKVTVTNTSTSDIEIYLWRIATTGTPSQGSGGNWAVRQTIPAGKTETITKLMGHVLDNNMSLFGSAGTASVVNIDISGTIEL